MLCASVLLSLVLSICVIMHEFREPYKHNTDIKYLKSSSIYANKHVWNPLLLIYTPFGTRCVYVRDVRRRGEI